MQRLVVLLSVVFLASCGGASSADAGSGGGTAAGGGVGNTGGGSATTGGGTATTGGGSATTGGGTATTGGGTATTGGGTATAGGGTATTGGGTATTGGGSGVTGGGTGAANFPSGKYTTFNVSGTRLTATAMLDPLGNSAVVWFNDTFFNNVRCTPQLATDGQLRCLPMATESTGVEVIAGGQEGGAYKNDTCSIPLLRAPKACVLPGNAPQYFSMARSDGYAIYSRGPVVTTAYTWRRLPNNSVACAPGPVVADNEQLLDVGSPMDPANFVAFTVGNAGTDPLARAALLVGSDGSALATGVWDAANNSAARLISSGSSATPVHLVPAPHSVYAPQLVSTACGTGNSQAYLERTAATPAYVEVITQQSQPPFNMSITYRPVTGTQSTYCQNGSAQTAQAGYSVYVLGDNGVPLNAFPTVELVIDTRAGERFQHVRADGGAPVVPYPHGIFAVDGTSVGAVFANPDGGLNRLPGGAFESVVLYGNSTCTQPVTTTPDPVTMVYLPENENIRCDALGLRWSQVGGVYQATGTGGISRPVYSRQNGVCTLDGNMVSRFASPVAVETLMPALTLGAP